MHFFVRANNKRQQISLARVDGTTNQPLRLFFVKRSNHYGSELFFLAFGCSFKLAGPEPHPHPLQPSGDASVGGAVALALSISGG